jgi:hypothetical protein
MNNKGVTWAVGACALLFAARAAAGTTSGPVLSDSLEARGLALGDAQAGLADVAAFQVNPAAVAGIGGDYASAFFKPEPLGLSTGSLRYAHPFGFGTIAGQVTYRSMGDLNFVTSSGEDKTVSAGSDLVIGVSYGRTAFGPVNAGVTIKMIRSSLVEEYSAFGVAADLGGTVRLPLPGATAGFVARNLGTGLKYLDKTEPLPSEIRVGGSYDMNFGGFGALVAVDAIYGMGEGVFAVGGGVEGSWKRMLSLRVGYRMGSELKNLALGLGFTWQDTRLDYAVQPMAESFGVSHAVSISYRFGGGAAKAGLPLEPLPALPASGRRVK